MRLIVMMRHFPRPAGLALALGWAAAFSLAPASLLAAETANDPPADLSSSVSADSKAVGMAVKRDAKAVAQASKEGARHVAAASKEFAHKVAAASKQGAHEVAAAAKRGAEKTKAAVKGKKN